MRRISLALAVCALVVAVAPGVAGAKTLSKRVKVLEAKMSCVKRTAMSTYIGYAFYDNDGSGNVHVLADPSGLTDSFPGANFGQAIGDTSAPDHWVLVVRNTSECRARFGVVANPYGARPAVQHVAARARMLRLARF
ncbi:MAG TPA: hypothetical protein VG479_00195 [Gaiellaceae bacterium]|jgi:hypothetical protein|nr:hypothetical protein [Gaiellaceae bacterium]